jgi:hypothetical protein
MERSDALAAASRASVSSADAGAGGGRRPQYAGVRKNQGACAAPSSAVDTCEAYQATSSQPTVITASIPRLKDGARFTKLCGRPLTYTVVAGGGVVKSAHE